MAAKGAPIRIVAGRELLATECTQALRIFGARSSFPEGLHDLRQLVGRKVSINSRAGLREYVLEEALDTAGIGLEQVELVVLGIAEATAALVSGQLDAMMSFDLGRRPDSVSSEIVLGIPLADALPNLQYSFAIFGERLLNGDPALGKQFLAAYLLGCKDFLDGDTPRFMLEFATRSNLDLQRTRAACRGAFSVDGRIQLDDVRRFISWGVRRGYCPIPIEAEDLVDLQFLEPVLP